MTLSTMIKPKKQKPFIKSEIISEVENEPSGGESDIESSGQEDLNDDSDGSDIVKEELENETASNKRKFKDEEEKTQKKAKRNAKIKPPTAEEMLHLKEYENSSQLNEIYLLTQEINELISEIKPKVNFINKWMVDLKSFLFNLEDDSETTQLNDINLTKQKVNLPIPDHGKQQKGIFKFIKPADLFIIKSYGMSRFHISVALVMPKKCFQKDDNLNLRYHTKRALYLSRIASYIGKSDLVRSSPEFSTVHGDPFKPVLVLSPFFAKKSKKGRNVEITIHPILEKDSFKFKRFLPDRNNVRLDWWGIQSESSPPTPIYNATILEDIVLEENEKLRANIFDNNFQLENAFLLLRVWLKQRELLEGLGSFHSHILSMYLVYLVNNKKINKYMSSYEILRRFWINLSESDWTKDGPTLAQANVDSTITKQCLHSQFDLVFIDVTGYFNIAARLNLYIYLKVKEESKLAVQFLDCREVDKYQALFDTSMPFIKQYDNVICFKDPNDIERSVRDSGNALERLDLCGATMPQFIKMTTRLLQQGIGHRLISMGISCSSGARWDYNSAAPYQPPGQLMIGLCLNQDTALFITDKGPVMTGEPNPQAEEFREFWGEKCELKRFKDGSIRETVTWCSEEAATMDRRRALTSQIASYLLTAKLGLLHSPVSLTVLHDPFLEVISPPRTRGNLSREESCQKVHAAYEDLTRQLRDLPNLPLDIVSVHCISPVYRFTDPFPPEKPEFRKDWSPLDNHPIKGMIFESDVVKRDLQYIAPVDCVLQMALTQKWPDDINAGKRLIAAFYIAIAAELKKKNNLLCQITADYIVINKDGYLFRLYLGYSKEISLLKQGISEQGLKQYRDTPESIVLEKKFINLPKITGALYRLSEEYQSFGAAACLAKRWLSAMLLDDFHFPSVVAELLMAYLFVRPEPYKPPVNSLPAFLRFLSFLSTTDWSKEPIIVNFNSLMSKDDITEMKSGFSKERSSFPPLFLATPYDKSGSLWTKSAPTLRTLVFLAKLAAKSLQILESNLFSSKLSSLEIFRPPDFYHAVIKLRPCCQYRKMENINKNFQERTKILTINRQPVLPILDFNPADLYLQELRDNYGEFALFFHDFYGGTEIGVVFDPIYLKDSEFKIFQINGRKPISEDNHNILRPNTTALIEGFRVLGSGIVESIDLKLKTE